jgi:hypothetical protein
MDKKLVKQVLYSTLDFVRTSYVRLWVWPATSIYSSKFLLVVLIGKIPLYLSFLYSNLKNKMGVMKTPTLVV